MLWWDLYKSHNDSLNYQSHPKRAEPVIGYKELGLKQDETTRLNEVNLQESLLGWKNVVVYMLLVTYGSWF